MSFVVAFCHFCDIHGPSVLLSCQAIQQQTTDELRPSPAPSTAVTTTGVYSIPPTCKVGTHNSTRIMITILENYV